MAIGVYFHPASMNKDQYEKVLELLEEVGQDSPEGRQYHSCFGEGDKLMVFDIWDSKDDFDAFGKKLMPILESIGLDPGKPEIMPIVNIID